MKTGSIATLAVALLLAPGPVAAQQQAPREGVRHTPPRPAPEQRTPREVTHQSVTATVAHVRASPSDLAAFQLVNRETGAVMRVYYEPALRDLAAGHLPYLAWLIDEVARQAEAEAGQVIWHSIVFTADPDYQPPRAGNEVRWTVPATADGRLTPRGEEMLFAVIPHEQVHAVQKAAHPSLPRWFSEGHASWIELRITSRTRPDHIAEQRRRQQETLAAIDGPLSLGAWGGLRPRREAIYRQVSREDQARMDADPQFAPSGSFTFGPGDLMPDEVDQPPRYAASLRLFEDLERQAGAEAMARWQRAIWADPGPMNNARLTALAREHLGQDLAERLR